METSWLTAMTTSEDRSLPCPENRSYRRRTGAWSGLERACPVRRPGLDRSASRQAGPIPCMAVIAVKCSSESVSTTNGSCATRTYELNARLPRAGGSVWYDPEIRIRYYNQGILKGLLRQAFLSGQWNPWTWYVAPYAFAWRHAVPGVFVSWLLGARLLLFVAPPRRVGWRWAPRSCPTLRPESWRLSSRPDAAGHGCSRACRSCCRLSRDVWSRRALGNRPARRAAGPRPANLRADDASLRGRTALYATLKDLHLVVRDEVPLPGYTCVVVIAGFSGGEGRRTGVELGTWFETPAAPPVSERPPSGRLSDGVVSCGRVHSSSRRQPAASQPRDGRKLSASCSSSWPMLDSREIRGGRHRLWR